MSPTPHSSGRATSTGSEHEGGSSISGGRGSGLLLHVGSKARAWTALDPSISASPRPTCGPLRGTHASMRSGSDSTGTTEPSITPAFITVFAVLESHGGAIGGDIHVAGRESIWRLLLPRTRR